MRSGRALSRWCAVGGAVAAAVIVVQPSAGGSGSAGRAYAIPGRILPGVGVDHLRLGMSEQAAKRVLRPLGKPAIARRLPRANGREYVELRFPRNQTLPISYVVGTEGPRSSRVVVLISVHTWLNRTPRGVRIGDTERKLLRAYPGVDCKSTPYPHQYDDFGHGVFCTLGDRSERNTVFLLRPGVSDPFSRVLRIDIREPFVNLDPESQA